MKKLLIGMVLGLVCVFGFMIWHQPKENKVTSVLRIGVLKHESSLPIYIADELGFFTQSGLSVKLVELPPGDHMPALLSERVDILSPTSFPVLFGVMQNNPGLLYAVFPGAEVANGPVVYGFIVSKNSKASSIYDLKGKTVIAINPYTKLNIEAILSASGISRKSWPVIKVAAREAALQAISIGQAEAAIMDQPALAIAIASGEYRLLEANPRAKHIGSPYWSGAGAVMKQHWDENSSEYMTLMKAIDKAIVYTREHPEDSHRILAKRLGLDPSIVAQMGGYYFPESNETVDMNGIHATVDALFNARILEKTVDMNGFFPPRTYNAK